jgi:hypothetical protein
MHQEKSDNPAYDSFNGRNESSPLLCLIFPAGGAVAKVGYKKSLKKNGHLQHPRPPIYVHTKWSRGNYLYDVAFVKQSTFLTIKMTACGNNRTARKVFQTKVGGCVFAHA